MLENFNNLFLLILYVVHIGLLGFYAFRCVVVPKGLAEEFNVGKDSIYLVRVIGTFALTIFLLGIYILFRPAGPDGTWIYFNMLFLLGLFQVVYDMAFYFRLVDKDISARNGLMDIVVGTFFVISSIVLIVGLSEKIYAFSGF